MNGTKSKNRRNRIVKTYANNQKEFIKTKLNINQ